MSDNEQFKFITFNSVKRYLQKNSKYRVSNEAINELTAELNQLCNARTGKLLKITEEMMEPRLTTIWGRHIQKAISILLMRNGQ